jgi:hypothetical protein
VWRPGLRRAASAAGPRPPRRTSRTRSPHLPHLPHPLAVPSASVSSLVHIIADDLAFTEDQDCWGCPFAPHTPYPPHRWGACDCREAPGRAGGAGRGTGGPGRPGARAGGGPAGERAGTDTAAGANRPSGRTAIDSGPSISAAPADGKRDVLIYHHIIRRYTNRQRSAPSLLLIFAPTVSPGTGADQLRNWGVIPNSTPGRSRTDTGDPFRGPASALGLRGRPHNTARTIA